MTIRELFSCVDTECCTKMQICSANHVPINLFVDWTNDQDPDFNVLDRLADILTVARWYVTVDGMIRIGSQDSIDWRTAEFIKEVL